MDRDRTIEEALYARLQKAKDEHGVARGHFDAILKEGAGTAPHPDGALRIEMAGRESSITFRRYMAALKQFTDFLTKDIVPDDLKPPG